MAKYILAIDQGTTSSRAILFTEQGKVKGIAQREFAQHFPADGWVEHDPEDIWQTVLTTCQQVLTEHQLTAADIAAIGITNQRETTIVWDKNSGEPIYNAIVWQDRRTAERCQQLRDQGYESDVTDKTGLLLAPYFSATKVGWLLDNVDGARERAQRGELAFGTVDSFLLWKLTGGRSHKTDATNASRTMLYNIHQNSWDQSLLELFDVPENMLPQVMDCADDFGVTEASLFGQPIAILGIAGDQQAALVGQACFKAGMAKSTYGTGCFFMLNTGEHALKSNNKLLTTIGYRLNGKTHYAIEGSIFMAGATIQWLRDGLKLFAHASETQAIAEQTPVDHGVFLVPAFTGLGAPYWDPDARGAIVGLTRDSGVNEIVSAGLQSVCYQTKDLQKAMEKDGLRPTHLRVDGGMVANDWLLGFLADVLGAKVERPQIIETTALGAAYLAGLQAGIFPSSDALSDMWHLDQTFVPKLDEQARNQLYSKWLAAVERVKSE
ncbi:glycerol kinase GlpK [Endozoicomonas sp. G2_1]|uniref:glycerol kinase GlpK n=1 Tax=Endozoicomonas sp. G2_1 TaxID=2821091 RepID=UPI001AD989D4|nr:glycerol kinase GlpK [Endozoicomonas sp. G2_1]MBO9490404.1 glycerol kinase GlpK [Endozoicomonas sp. G2_1]